jgi:Protein of unknown function DUF47
VLVAVRRTFITPFDRTDIQDLITSMDDAIDQMNKTAKTIVTFELRDFQPCMQQMSEIIVQSAQLVLEAVPLLSSIGTNAGHLNALTAKIINVEEEADEIYVIAWIVTLPASAFVAAVCVMFFLGGSLNDPPVLRPLLDAMVGDQWVERGNRFCDPQHPVRIKDIFERGHFFEAVSRQHLIAAGFEFATDEKTLSFEAADGLFRGHTDGKITAGPELPGLVWPALWECKALKAKGWREIERNGLSGPYQIYACQVAVYQGVSRS